MAIIEEIRSCRNCHHRIGPMWGSPECVATGTFCSIEMQYPSHCGQQLKLWTRRRPYLLRVVLWIIGRS